MMKSFYFYKTRLRPAKNELFHSKNCPGKKLFLPLFIFFFISFFVHPAFSQTPESVLSSRTAIDWQTGTIKMEASIDIVRAGIRLPAGRMEAERLLDSYVPDSVRSYVYSILVDSYRTVSDTLSDGSLNPAELEQFLESGKKLKSAFSRDLKNFNAEYEWLLADLVKLYVRHSVALEPAKPDYYTPGRSYSGIIIYAKGKLPVRGEHREGFLEPCLFPRIFDSSMNTIFERNSVYPDVLKNWGPLVYSYGKNIEEINNRTGTDPMRIIAQGFFGSFRTDIVLSNEDAGKILTLEANRELLKQGRIVVIFD